MATQTSSTNAINGHTVPELIPASTKNGSNNHEEHENGTLVEPVDNFAPRFDHKEPLKLSGALNQFKHFDTTPLIGTEFPEANLVDWMNAPNSDQFIRDLAITGERLELTTSSKNGRGLLLIPNPMSSVPARSGLLPRTRWSRYRTPESVGSASRRAIGKAKILYVAYSSRQQCLLKERPNQR